MHPSPSSPVPPLHKDWVFVPAELAVPAAVAGNGPPSMPGGVAAASAAAGLGAAPDSPPAATWDARPMAAGPAGGGARRARPAELAAAAPLSDAPAATCGARRAAARTPEALARAERVGNVFGAAVCSLVGCYVGGGELLAIQVGTRSQHPFAVACVMLGIVAGYHLGGITVRAGAQLARRRAPRPRAGDAA